MGIAVSRGKAILVEEIRVFQASYLGDFRVAFPLCFKASPSAKPFIWKVVKIHLNQNLRANKTHFHMKGFALGLALEWRRIATRKSRLDWHFAVQFLCRSDQGWFTAILINVTPWKACYHLTMFISRLMWTEWLLIWSQNTAQRNLKTQNHAVFHGVTQCNPTWRNVPRCDVTHCSRRSITQCPCNDPWPKTQSHSVFLQDSITQSQHYRGQEIGHAMTKTVSRNVHALHDTLQFQRLIDRLVLPPGTVLCAARRWYKEGQSN